VPESERGDEPQILLGGSQKPFARVIRHATRARASTQSFGTSPPLAWNPTRDAQAKLGAKRIGAGGSPADPRARAQRLP